MPEKRSILIYTPRITNRHLYIFDFLKEYFGDEIGVRITSSKSDLSIEAQGQKVINYSPEDFPCTYKICPCGLLEMDSFSPFPVSTGLHGDIITLFPSEDIEALPFDIFGAIFYLLSRYEEYEEFTPDAHGRFSAEASVLYKCNSLHIPVIDHWLRWFATVIFESGISILKNDHRTEFTMDVDHPFKYYGKSLFKKAGLWIRGDATINQLIGGPAEDPFHSFEVFKQITPAGQRPSVFFLVNSDGRHNSSTSPGNTGYREIIRNMASYCNVGLHNSYNSYNNIELLRKEKQLLEEITGSRVNSIRQHFLRMRIPEYYSTICELGITDDYSMGFSAQNSFRAGTSLSFYWYDLVNERSTSLRVHPFSWMDATYTYYKTATDAEIVEELRSLKSRLSKVGAVFRGLVHNDHLSGVKPYNNWQNIIRLLNSPQ